MGDRRKKVCFIISTFDSGGTENYLLRFLKYSKNKIDATVLCKGDSCSKGSLKIEYEKLKLPIVCQSIGYLNISKLWNLYNFLKENHFDTICDLTGNFGGLPMLVSRVIYIENRIVFYRRSSYAFKPTSVNLVYNFIVNKLVYFNATKILSNSQHAINYFFPYKTIKDKKFKVIYNGIDINSFNIKEGKDKIRYSLKIKDNVFLIGHIGRYDSSKNHCTIFKVAKRLINHNPNIEFLFCGKNTNTVNFRNQIEKYGITNNVYMLGERHDIPRILKTLDLFYFPSITEGQPNALIEAMISDLPILTSNINPIKEIIPKNERYKLIEPYEIDKPIDIIIKLMKKECLRKQYKMKDWALKNFDSNTNFKIFEEELL